MAGFCDAEGLLAVVSAWRALFALLRPAALLLDHAPFALLAARGAGIPSLLVGSGFSVPPRLHPFPDFRPRTPSTIAESEGSDDRVIDAVNSVLKGLGVASLARLNQLFDAEENFLCTFPELDHYRERESGARYWGPISMWDGFTPPAWPPACGPRVFVYLRPSLKNLDTVLAQLAHSGASVVAHVPGLSDEAVCRLASEKVHIARRPVDLIVASRSAHLGVTYAGAGATTALLLGGVPVLMFPQHLEQYLYARRVAEVGAGVIVEHVEPTHDYAALAVRMAADETLRGAAREFARKYSGFDSETAADAVVARIEGYL